MKRKTSKETSGVEPTASTATKRTATTSDKWTTWDVVFLPVYVLIEIFSLRPLRNWVRVWIDRYLLLSFVLFSITSWYIEPYIVWQVDFSVYAHSVCPPLHPTTVNELVFYANLLALASPFSLCRIHHPLSSPTLLTTSPILLTPSLSLGLSIRTTQEVNSGGGMPRTMTRCSWILLPS